MNIIVHRQETFKFQTREYIFSFLPSDLPAVTHYCYPTKVNWSFKNALSHVPACNKITLIGFTKAVNISYMQELLRSVTDRKLTSLIKRNVIVLDRLFVFHNKIFNHKMLDNIANVGKRSKHHQLSVLWGNNFNCTIMTWDI